MCQTHLISYWVREAEQSWALEKLLPWKQTCKREGDAWMTFKDCDTRWRNGTQERARCKSMEGGTQGARSVNG